MTVTPLGIEVTGVSPIPGGLRIDYITFNSPETEDKFVRLYHSTESCGEGQGTLFGVASGGRTARISNEIRRVRPDNITTCSLDWNAEADGYANGVFATWFLRIGDFDNHRGTSQIVSRKLVFANRSAYRPIRGSQIAETPRGVTTAHLPTPLLEPTPLGRRMIANHFFTAAKVNAAFIDGAIGSVAARKIQTRALSETKFAQGMRDRLGTPDKSRFVACQTVGDMAGTGLTLVGAPAIGSYVAVIVNGRFQEVGDGVRSTHCYFSADRGVTARAYGTVCSGDELYWNGAVVGIDLRPTDRVDFLYTYSSF